MISFNHATTVPCNHPSLPEGSLHCFLHKYFKFCMPAASVFSTMVVFKRQTAMVKSAVILQLLGLFALLLLFISSGSTAEDVGTQRRAKMEAPSFNRKNGIVSTENGKADSVLHCSKSFSRQEKFPNWKSNTDGVLNLPLMHVYGECSPFRPPNSTWPSLILQSVKNDEKRLKLLNPSIDAVRPAKLNPEEDEDEPVASGGIFDPGNYIIKIGVGTPVQSLYTAIDTGSDITWIPCNPCSNCQSKASPPFDISKSSSYKPLSCASPPCLQLVSDPNCGNSSCDYTASYGDGSKYNAVLSSDTLRLATNSIAGFYFGCAHSLTGLIQTAPGLIGLGRKNISLLSQTANLFGKTFSYCLPSRSSSAFSGSLHLGKGALSVPGLKSTPLLQNPSFPSLYYVGLTGISLGGQPVSIPSGTFALDTSNGGGTIIDSGTLITRLVNPAYSALRKAFRLKLSNLTNGAVPTSFQFLDTCYNVSYGSIDDASISITLHFDNKLDLPLPKENILIPANDAGTVVCLAFAVPPAGRLSVLSIIGNFQQQNLRVVYDIANSQLGFAKENCSA